ncbi:MAG: DUF6265 family protein [Planctomycetota bacterium]
MMHTTIATMLVSLLPQPTIDAADLGFLAGIWRGAAGPIIYEETWLPPRAGNLTGVFRMIAPGDNGEQAVSVVEIMTITEARDSNDLVYRLRHFNASLVPWASEADGPIEAIVTLGGEQRVRFEPINVEWGIRSFEYAVEGDVLTATVTPTDEARQPVELTFRRIPG